MANYDIYNYNQIVYFDGVRSNIHLSIINEYFKFTINSGDDSSFILPLSGGYYRTDMQEYNLLVDWGDGTEEIVSGTSTEQGHGYEHTYSSANTNYQITLRPNGDVDGWGGSFGFSNGTTGCDTSSNKSKMISLDSELSSQMIKKASSTEYVCAYMFYDCPNLTMSSEFNLPWYIVCNDSLNYFCETMFAKCSSLTMNNIFNLPLNISVNVGAFCHNMFASCSSLTMNEVFNLPQNITTDEGLFCMMMFDSCSNLQLNDVFQLPQNIDTGSCFCQNMFYNCTNIATGVQKFFGDLVLSQEQLDQDYYYGLSGVYLGTFYGCSGITEECSANTIPQLSVIPSNYNGCFNCASDIARQNCPYNWGGLLS